MIDPWPGLAKWVGCISLGEQVVLWNHLTGRSISLHHETLRRPLSPPLRQRLQRAWMWADGPHLEWEELIPCRSKCVLFLPDDAVLWIPVPHHRTAGGFGYRALRLSAAGFVIWHAINDSRTIAQVARHCGATLLQIQAFCTELCAPGMQVLQLRTSAPRPSDPSLQRLVALERPNNDRVSHLYGTSGETDLIHYHLHEITDGDTHFDNRETTVAHALGRPHPALGGVAFGARLYERISAHKPLADAHSVVEVGCGTGEMAQAWLSAANGGPGSHYTRIDLSPELLATQARNAPESLGLLGNATALPLSDESVDVLLSNEVIADLSAVPVAPEAPSDAARIVLSDIERYGLEMPQATTLFNHGAWQFVEEIARVLRPGGLAYVSEFGSLDLDPEEASQLDHPEVSIQFGHLKHIATRLGLTAECIRMDQFMEIDIHQVQPARHSWMALRALAASQNRHLSARAWVPEDATNGALFPFPIQGIQWTSLSSEGPGPLITRFWVLLLRKCA